MLGRAVEHDILLCDVVEGHIVELPNVVIFGAVGTERVSRDGVPAEGKVRKGMVHSSPDVAERRYQEKRGNQ